MTVSLAAHSASNTTTLIYPPGILANDILIIQAFAVYSDGSPLTIGFSDLHGRGFNQLSLPNTDPGPMGVFWRLCDGTESSQSGNYYDPTLPTLNPGVIMRPCGQCAVARGASSTPIDAKQSTITASAKFSFLTITTTMASDLILLMGATNKPVAGLDTDTVAGFTRADGARTSFVGCEFFSATQVAIGATGLKQNGLSLAGDNYSATIAINAPSGGGGGGGGGGGVTAVPRGQGIIIA